MAPILPLLIFERADCNLTEFVRRTKLCDFGLSSEDSDSSHQTVVYHSTPGWRPSKVIEQEKPGSLQLCDIFAFGTVIWSVFARRGKAPITALEKSQGTACQPVRRNIRSRGEDGRFHFDLASKTFVPTKEGSWRPAELFQLAARAQALINPGSPSTHRRLTQLV
ncbi:hypothetical protein BDZ45DRAFT_740998 [Acephala macrosclerotiorum]|nr:hypothetical protein BDZ45DRAFT_740998 [Acephala macrosclerotiorum]